MQRLKYCAITLITSPGKGLPLVEELFKQGHKMVDLHHARGSVVGGAQKKNGLPIESEQEIVTCVVPMEQADEVFGVVYELGRVGEPGGGFLYMQRLDRSTQLEISASL